MTIIKKMFDSVSVGADFWRQNTVPALKGLRRFSDSHQFEAYDTNHVTCTRIRALGWDVAHWLLASPACVPSSGFLIHILVSPFSMWLGDHVIGGLEQDGDALCASSQYGFRTARCSRCTVCLKCCIKTCERHFPHRYHRYPWVKSFSMDPSVHLKSYEAN